MHLLLIRHGETDWNDQRRIQGHTDTKLNSCGIEQAHRLALRFAEEKLDVLYASPLSRARMTAEIIGKRIGLAPVIDERLIERGLGDVEGLTSAEFEMRFPDLYRQWKTSPVHVPIPNEESLTHLQERIRTFLADLRAFHPNGQRIGIVSHGGTFCVFVGMLIGLDINRRSPFWFDNASVTSIDMTGSQPRVKFLNDTWHLNDKLPMANPGIARQDRSEQMTVQQLPITNYPLSIPIGSGE